MELIQRIAELDLRWFLYLNSFHNDYWDTIMLMITRKETWLPFYAIILFFIIKNYRSKWWIIVLFLALDVLLADQISVLFKDTFQRFRPVHNPDIEHMVHNVLRKGGLYGFVSSHAANAFAITIFLTRIFRNRGFWVLMIFWSLIFSYSRIYSGVHYPLDIVGGAFLGWLIGFGVYKAMMFIEIHFFLARNPKIEITHLSCRQTGLIYLVFFVLMTTVFIMAMLLHKYNYL
jgi:undecaprenyl-diphosphatase